MITITLQQAEVHKRTVSYEAKVEEDRLPPVQKIYLNMAHLRRLMGEQPNAALKNEWPAQVEVSIKI